MARAHHTWQRRLLLTSVLGAALFAATSADAQIPPLQWQLLAQGAVDSELERPLGEVQVNIGIYGIGLAIGLGGGASLPDDEERAGWSVFLDLALQLRPFMMAASFREVHRPVYHIFDPHLDIGGLLGVHVDEEARFLGVLYIGAALDFGIPVTYYWMQSQLLLSVGYRFVPLQRPLRGQEHHFVIGVGFRGGY